MFELTLTTYHHLYDIPMSVLNVGGVYGPWQSHDQPHQCWYVSDVVKMIAVISRAKETCKIETLLSCQNTSRDQNLMEIISQYNLSGLTSLDDGRRTTKAWIQSHLSRPASTTEMLCSLHTLLPLKTHREKEGMQKTGFVIWKNGFSLLKSLA